jgi:hypothetical protein
MHSNKNTDSNKSKIQLWYSLEGEGNNYLQSHSLLLLH